ncbi:MAG: hypothetical protein ACFFDI_11215 [Promethearchaeota archaeon]
MEKIKKIEINWPDADITVSASLQEEEEPELCKLLWDDLKQPLKTVSHHVLSTGNVILGMGRPPKHPTASGTQRQPVGRKKWLFTQIEPGMIVYSGANHIWFNYGYLTEALPIHGSVVAKVDEEDYDDYVKACNVCWNAQYITHNPVIIMVRRKEE